MNEGRGKVYGLSFPTRKPKNEQKLSISSVFDEESDKEEEHKEFKPRDPSRTTCIAQSRIDRKVKTELEKAFEEDPSVFQYDELLDTIHEQKAEDISKSTVKTVGLLNSNFSSSSILTNLWKASNERKLERELCAERKAQKSIEAEADLYHNKESFVTSAYKSKLNELQALVEKRKKEEEREEVMDICKQDGLGGFYRFMFDNQDKTCAGYTESESHTSTNNGENCSKADMNVASKVKPSTIKENSMKKDQNIKERCDDDDDHHNHNKGDDDKKVSLPPPSRNDATENDRKDDDKTRTHHHHHQSKKDMNTPTNTGQRKVPGVVLARPRVTTDEELAAARQRYLDRKAAGIHAVIVESD